MGGGCTTACAQRHPEGTTTRTTVYFLPCRVHTVVTLQNTRWIRWIPLRIDLHCDLCAEVFFAQFMCSGQTSFFTLTKSEGNSRAVWAPRELRPHCQIILSFQDLWELFCKASIFDGLPSSESSRSGDIFSIFWFAMNTAFFAVESNISTVFGCILGSREYWLFVLTLAKSKRPIGNWLSLP